MATSFRHNGVGMTAIVWAYAPDGFVIAADGRRMDADTHQVVSDEVQKIYSVKVDEFRLVYAWRGNTYLEMKNGAVIDFKIITDCIVQSMDMTTINAFAEFVERFRDALFPISRFIFEKNLQMYRQDRPIISVVFLSYFRGNPYFSELEILHDGNKILRPEAKSHPAVGKFRIFSGSEIAHKEFGKWDTTSLTLSHLATEAKRYIETCFRYQNVDPDASGIGGHIHIGQLRAQGFAWLISPRI